MKIKTSKLEGVALDWATECALGTHWSSNGYFIYNDRFYPYSAKPRGAYSNDWAQGGPIIEREKINFLCGDGSYTGNKAWSAHIEDVPLKSSEEITGPTPLIAAMRCFVASKLGDEIEIPKELAYYQRR